MLFQKIVGRRLLTACFGAVLAVGSVSNGYAEEYLCTTKPFARGDAIAASMLIDVRHGLYAMIFDSYVKESHGAPVTAEITRATSKKYDLTWQVRNLRIPASAMSTQTDNGPVTVTYFASLNRKTMEFRVRARAVGVANMGAEGKCVLRK